MIFLGILIYYMLGIAACMLTNLLHENNHVILGDVDGIAVWIMIVFWPLIMIIGLPIWLTNWHGTRHKEKLRLKEENRRSEQDMLNEIKQLKKDLADALLTK